MVSRPAIQREDLFDFLSAFGNSGIKQSLAIEGDGLNPAQVASVENLGSDGRRLRRTGSSRNSLKLGLIQCPLQLAWIGGVIQRGFQVHDFRANQLFKLGVEVLHAFGSAVFQCFQQS